jgi:hypothetical protein
MTDDLMLLADAVFKPDSEGGRAGVSQRPGAVSGFANPNTRVPLQFGEGRDRLVGCVELGDGPSRPGTPSLPPPEPGPQPGPTPHPPTP